MGTDQVLPEQVSPPEFSLSAQLPDALSAPEAVAIPVLPTESGLPVLIGPGAAELGERWNVDLLAMAETFEMTGKGGSIATFPASRSGEPGENPVLVILVGVGDQTPTDFRRAGAALARATRDRGHIATTVPAIADERGFEAFIVGMTLGSFVFHWRSAGPEHSPVKHVVLAGIPAAASRADEVARAQAIGAAAWKARFLATVPSNVKTPEWLAQQAREVADAHDLDVKVWNEQELADQGFGGIVGVGQGSASPPRLDPPRLHTRHQPDFSQEPAFEEAGGAGGQGDHL